MYVYLRGIFEYFAQHVENSFFAVGILFEPYRRPRTWSPTD